MYVDGFLVPVQKARVAEYTGFAQEMAELWLKHGALSVVEAMADDVPDGQLTSFPMAVKLEPGEVVVFSWVTYADRAARDAVAKAVMDEAGARISAMMKDNPPMNPQRMVWGGFASVLVAEAQG